jgi:outer membrane lipoprotein-sorting protein
MERRRRTTRGRRVTAMPIDRRQFLALAASAALGSIAGEAEAANIDAALTKIAKARANIKSLQAPFTQKRVIGLLASEIESKGLLTLVRPHQLRWDLKPPDAVSYYIGPKGLAIANEDGVTRVGKAAAGRFAAVLGDLMIMLGGDLAKLKKRYQLAIDESGGGFVLTAKPKAKDVAKHISKLEMEAGKNLWTVKRIDIYEKNGDRSSITFGKFTRDKAIPAAFMKPPKR